MTFGFFDGLVFGTILGAVSFVAGSWFAKKHAAKSAPAERPQEWHAMPGNRLELGATGFWIELDPMHPAADLIVWSPEGARVGSCRDHQLAEAKALAERCARARAEFDVKHMAWAGFISSNARGS